MIETGCLPKGWIEGVHQIAIILVIHLVTPAQVNADAVRLALDNLFELLMFRYLLRNKGAKTIVATVQEIPRQEARQLIFIIKCPCCSNPLIVFLKPPDNLLRCFPDKPKIIGDYL